MRSITAIAERVSGVILGFLPGMEGGEAIADILYGDYNPDGKLPISYPRNTNDIVMYDHKPLESYNPHASKPLYPFGHGLSYTTFQISALKKAFKKIGLIPGQAENLSFTLTPYDLSFIGVDLKRIIEPGDFKCMVGNETVNFSVTKQ